MGLAVFTKGLVIGLIMCAPVGPIGLFCVRQTLARGRLVGLLSVLGASVMDCVYCAIAGFGLTFVSSFLERQQAWLEFIGGIILVLLGARIFLSTPPDNSNQTSGNGTFRAFSRGFLLMLANPMPILVFTAAFAALGIQGWKGEYMATFLLVGGVFVGSALWAPILVGVVSLFGDRYNPAHIRWANRVSGALIALLGAALALVTLLGPEN